MSVPLVQMTGIRKTYGAKIALDGADLDLRRKEILGLVGDNGAGKSTLLKALAGVVRVDAGEIRLDGVPVHLASPRRARDLGIEIVYQDLALCESLTIWENIFLGRCRTRGFFPFLDKRGMAQKAREALASLGLDRVDVNRPVRDLSGGEQQAAALGRCLLFSPRVVLLDEPTASMALWEKKKIRSIIREMRENGAAVIMVSHDLPEVLELADRVLVLQEGRPVRLGPCDGLGPEDLARMMFVGKNGWTGPGD
ncbi:MAG: ATP-binding cassette domain-containing protein [Pseudomonadota bacterium]